MLESWNTLPLEDYMAAFIDYRGKSPEKTTFGVPLVTAKIVKDGRIEKPEEFIAEADFENWMRHGMPKPGDIVMTTDAPLGEVAQLDDRKVSLAQRAITLRGKLHKIIPAEATVVVARGATTGRLTMFGHAMAMNQRCYGLCSKLNAPYVLYCNARHFIERLVQGGHGSIFDTITTSAFESIAVLLAPKEVLLAVDKQVTHLFQQVLANFHQSRNLATLRDTLLPKLLSGEVSI